MRMRRGYIWPMVSYDRKTLLAESTVTLTLRSGGTEGRNREKVRVGAVESALTFL